MKHEDVLELLPWYATGSLEPEDARAVEDHLASCSSAERTELMAELDELKLIHSAVSADGPEEPTFRPGLIQSALLEIEAMEAAEQREAVETHRTGPWARLKDAFSELSASLQWSATPRFARVAVISQLALVIGLAAALTLRAPEETEYGVLSGQGAGTPSSGPLFSVVFEPEAAHSAITTFLVEQNLTVVAGPSALGVYTVSAAREAEPEALMKTLEASPLTTFVAPVPK